MYREELYEEGIVQEAKDRIAIISIQDSDRCEDCTAKIYCKTGNTDERSLSVRDHYGVQPGDKVRVVINGSKILSASFMLYGIPLNTFTCRNIPRISDISNKYGALFIIVCNGISPNIYALYSSFQKEREN